MCLIVFAWQVIPGMPLIAAANRDEFFSRPASAADWWPDHPHVYAGRDLEAGGTWMGITRNGRFAALTNVRDPAFRRERVTSRGMLVADYLAGDATPEEYVASVSQRSGEFNGFNLLVGDAGELFWFSNASTSDERNGRRLVPGVYGLSNAGLDTPWPKVVRTKAQFASLLCQGASEEAYFDMLADTTCAADCRLPNTGVGLEWERILSAVCIDSPGYGTRTSTVVTLNADRSGTLRERPVTAVKSDYVDAPPKSCRICT